MWTILCGNYRVNIFTFKKKKNYFTFLYKLFNNFSQARLRRVVCVSEEVRERTWNGRTRRVMGSLIQTSV